MVTIDHTTAWLVVGAFFLYGAAFGWTLCACGPVRKIPKILTAAQVRRNRAKIKIVK